MRLSGRMSCSCDLDGGLCDESLLLIGFLSLGIYDSIHGGCDSQVVWNGELQPSTIPVRAKSPPPSTD